MTAIRKLVYYVATSVDHFIAHPDESMTGFLTEGPHIQDYLYSLRDFDTVLMGRRTYEWGFQFGVAPGQAVPTYGHMQQYVFSHTLQDSQCEQLQVVRQEACEFVKELKTQSGQAIYLCGGGALAGSLMAHGLVDEIILKVNPVLFGEGIPAFGDFKEILPLHLESSKVYANGVMFQHYQVNHV